MLGNVNPTPIDLRFSLFGIPVRVHPFFWLFSALLGWNQDPRLTLVWIACVFLSILVHEFGHALTAKYFGYPPHVVLYSFGGYAAFQPYWGYTTRRAVLILFAGPGAGFLLFFVILGVQELLRRFELFPRNEEQLLLLVWALGSLKYINLWWGLVNLLPVYPLDGGQISRHLMTHWRRDGVDLSVKISLVVAVGCAVYFFSNQQQYAGILFALLAYESYQMLRGGLI